MTDILVWKEQFIRIYQKFGNVIRPVLRFLVAFLTFSVINHSLNYGAFVGKLSAVVVLSLVAAFVPASILVLLSAFVALAQIYEASLELALLSVVMLLILYLLFIRYSSDTGYAVLFIPILFFLKIPYLVPIVLGLVAGPAAIVSSACGVAAFYWFQHVNETISQNYTGKSVEDIVSLYRYVLNGYFADRQMVMAMVIFSVVLLITYLFRRMDRDYAFYIAIGAGCVVNLITFSLGALIFDVDVNIFAIFAGTVVSGALALVLELVHMTLDYKAVETTQFEDDDYYYYVKAVPKVKVTAPKKKVKRIHAQKSTENGQDISRAIENVTNIPGAEVPDLEEEFDDLETIDLRNKR